MDFELSMVEKPAEKKKPFHENPPLHEALQTVKAACELEWLDFQASMELLKVEKRKYGNLLEKQVPIDIRVDFILMMGWIFAFYYGEENEPALLFEVVCRDKLSPINVELVREAVRDRFGDEVEQAREILDRFYTRGSDVKGIACLF